MKDLNDKSGDVVTDENSHPVEFQQTLNVEELLRVEGGDDNDEDDCLIGQCFKGSKNCYTGA